MCKNVHKIKEITFHKALFYNQIYNINYYSNLRVYAYIFLNFEFLFKIQSSIRLQNWQGYSAREKWIDWFSTMFVTSYATQ